MKARLRKGVAILMIMLVCFGPAMQAEAGTRLVWLGRRTGWVTIHGDTYYIHETRSRMYNRGEPCWDAYRWRGNKLYYFRYDGKLLKHDTKLIRLNRDHSVRYIYTPGNKNERYSTKRGRYQKRGKDGKWQEYGMQTNIYWMCDWQL